MAFWFGEAGLSWFKNIISTINEKRYEPGPLRSSESCVNGMGTSVALETTDCPNLLQPSQNSGYRALATEPS